MKHTFLLALAFAMCGIAAPASAAPNPCKLVTPSEAAKALGMAVLPAKRETGGGNTACRYLNAAQDQNVLVQVYDRVSDFPDVLLTAPGVKHVPQIGPKAVMGSGTLFMIKHGTYVTIGLYKGPNKTDDAALVNLGKLAASRM